MHRCKQIFGFDLFIYFLQTSRQVKVIIINGAKRIKIRTFFKDYQIFMITQTENGTLVDPATQIIVSNCMFFYSVTHSNQPAALFRFV